MRHHSIRLKLTLWFSLILTAVAAITLLAVLAASRLVLRGTLRNYLLSTVEANVDKIEVASEPADPDANLYIPYRGSYLEIDLDFLEVVSDVHTALYTPEGAMLYGENPLSRETSSIPFTESRLWRTRAAGVSYHLYDRKLTLAEGETLWLRGMVSEARSDAQLHEILRLSLILLPVLILLALFSGYLLVDRLLSPLRRIEDTAEQISRGDDLGRRIPVGKSNDEVGRLARVFNRMLDRLEASFEAERRFTSDASHELRTPTAVILAQSEYTLERERRPEEYVEALEVVKKQGTRMQALIGDMLDYTRMEQPSNRRFELLDLSGLVTETAEQLALLREKDIRLITRVEEGISLIGDKLLLGRLLQNLVQNAYRYGREGGQIQVSLTRREGQIVLSVTDDGIGIPPEEQEKIFDRFYRGDASRSVQGTGLGLSMVKKIAELHGASVTLESTPDVGSTFRILFSKTPPL